MPDTALADRVLAHIETHPKEWDQTWYAERHPCGTAYCFAGHTVRLAHPTAEFLFGDSLAAAVRVDGVEHYIGELAAKLLDLSHLDELALFDGSNTLEDLRAMVADLHRPGFQPGDLHALKPNPLTAISHQEPADADA
jgi:hypothetical protein